jgi:hypothetical protein
VTNDFVDQPDVGQKMLAKTLARRVTVQG